MAKDLKRRSPEQTAKGEGKTYEPKKKNPKFPNIVSVYLNAEIRERLDLILEETGQSRNAIMKYAVVYFLDQYEKDKKILEFQTVKTLKY